MMTTKGKSLAFGAPAPEGPSNASECGYVEAANAERQAQRDYESAQQASAPRSRIEEQRRRHEAAEAHLQQAAQCEERARSWSDLLAQQQSARAAISSAQTARTAIIWTFFEILALLATIAVGVWAIVEGRTASSKAQKLAENTLRVQQRPWLDLDVVIESDLVFGEDRDEGTFYVCAKSKNIGLMPALNCWIGEKTFRGGVNNERALAEIFEEEETTVLFGDNLFPNSTLAESLPIQVSYKSARRAQRVTIYFYVFYRSPIDLALHYTIRVFDFFVRSDSLSPTEQVFPADQLYLERSMNDPVPT